MSREKLRALEKYFSLSDCTDLKNDSRDFWTFSEI
jgi:hypothetical protein